MVAALACALTLACPSGGQAQKLEEPEPPPVVDVNLDVNVDVHVQTTDSERPPSLQPEAEVRPPGTHFFVEANLGANLTGGTGPIGSLVLGAGGKLRGFPLRFYLVTELAYGYGRRDLPQVSGGDASEERRFMDTSIALRTYLPIGGPLRLFFEVGGGFTRDRATIQRPSQRAFRGTRLTGLGVLSLGLQVRLLHQLSVGARLRVRYADDALSDLRSELGADNPHSRALTGTATWHF